MIVIGLLHFAEKKHAQLKLTCYLYAGLRILSAKEMLQACSALDSDLHVLSSESCFKVSAMVP
jgi:hypothetical protein